MGLGASLLCIFLLHILVIGALVGAGISGGSLIIAKNNRIRHGVAVRLVGGVIGGIIGGCVGSLTLIEVFLTLLHYPNHIFAAIALGAVVGAIVGVLAGNTLKN